MEFEKMEEIRVSGTGSSRKTVVEELWQRTELETIFLN